MIDSTLDACRELLEIRRGATLVPEHYEMRIDQGEAAEGIENEVGTQKALEYLVGEKFLNFLESTETEFDF